MLLVGSGPSCEIGYPSWEMLARLTYNHLNAIGRISDTDSYDKYIYNRQYPELFRQAERDLQNDRDALSDILKALLTPTLRKHSVIYELISKWPFASYLTTNYDDEIAYHLETSGQHFTTVRNRKEDFHLWRDGISNLIQKLHSDLNHPDEAILTSADYQRIYTGDSGQYFRDKLCYVFAMFDVFIIGHSLSDPDIDYILRLAKNRRGPAHPIYMAAADFTRADEQEFLEKYNIALVGYSNVDGSHSELRRMLKAVDRFIVPRHRFRERIVLQPRPQDEMEAAIAISLYRRLQGVQATNYLTPLILSGLHLLNGQGIATKSITSLPPLNNLIQNRTNFIVAVEESVKALSHQGLVTEVAGITQITEDGRARVQEYQSIRRMEMDQAYGQFRLNLRNIYNSVTDSQLNQCQVLVEKIIVTSFANRGSVIANKIFSDQSARPDELADVFGWASDKAVEIDDGELRAAFIEAVYQFLVEPNLPQRRYLASVSQGYFLYHLLGLDPKCGEARRDIFQKTLWLCDSSVILPRVAVGCHNHDYATELFRMLADENALLYTTRRLLQEAWNHLVWAIRFVKKHSTESLEFLRAALVKGSYKQNLFLDGYIQFRADGKIGTFADYLELVLGTGQINRHTFDRTVAATGIRVTDISDLDGFVQEDWGDLEYAKEEIQKGRQARGIYRSPLQVESEAEIWILIQNLRSGKYSMAGLENDNRAYFVSQSRIIDQAIPGETVTTWNPEALYRYLSAMPGRNADPDLLQQCMLHEYYYAGISFIDKDRYEHFFGPSIDACKVSYEKEKENYVREVEDTFAGALENAFEVTPDLEKPFFVAQMVWQQAESSRRREKITTQRLAKAEARIKQLESERGKAWRIRAEKTQKQEEARLRNLLDPKHVRKRRRQAKKRKRKKRK